MAKKFLVPIDMTKLEIRNLLLELIAGNAASPVEGQVWYDSTGKRIKFRTNAANLSVVTDGGDLTAGSVLNTALATNPLARANHTGTQLAATISDFDTQVRLSRLDQMAVPTASVSMNSQRITNVLDPSGTQDAATKGYVDNAIAGLSWKEEVRVATTAAGTLASSFANGQTVDGVVLATDDRILIKNQASGSENGIYTVNASGAPTRATDADSEADIKGAALFISNGTTNAGTRWVLSNSGTITVGTTALTFVAFGGGNTYVAGDGLTESPAGTFNVGAGTGITVSANDVAIDTAVVNRKFSQTIGDGSSTSIVVTHSLGTKDIIPAVRQVADDLFVDCDIVATSTTTATFTFAVAPASNALRVTITG